MIFKTQRPRARFFTPPHRPGIWLMALLLGAAVTALQPVAAQGTAPAKNGAKPAAKSQAKSTPKSTAKSATKSAAKPSSKGQSKATGKGSKAGKPGKAGKASKAGQNAASTGRSKAPRAAPPSALAPPATTTAPTVADCQAAGHAQTLRALPPGAAADHAQAVAFDRQWLRWPQAADAPPAAADGRYVLVSDGQPLAVGQPLSLARVVASLPRTRDPLPAALTASQPHVAQGVDLQMPPPAQMRWPALLRGPLQLVETDGAGVVRRHTGLQLGALLDDLFGNAAAAATLGAIPSSKTTTFAAWAPTAQRVNVCLHAPGANPANPANPAQLLTMQRDDDTGIWRGQWPADLSSHTYTLLVDVHAPGTGMVRNKVTDPYSLSLNTDSQRSWIGSLDHPSTKPAGWHTAPRPNRELANTDLVVYELHLRDFSVTDDSVPPALRGKYGAFTQTSSRGMRHLQTLAAAGVTDVHLLPVFDFATVPERGCVTPTLTPDLTAKPDGETQQAAVMAQARNDCYNWGYDPLHFGAPEGSYASDPEDGAVRVREFRSMVQALHAAGLRVGMDMVYNHTSASGQAPQSVLDRIVPGYYQRLNANGGVETSTCCANTATERRMMAKLMVDTAAMWARDYRIDSMRFDLMGHQPRAAMEQLQAAVDRAAGRHIHLLGEGWNFGEVKDGARFVQASQGSLNGSGIATFSDRGRDALRGGGCCDNTPDTVVRQGWLNGQFVAPNGAEPAGQKSTREDLLRSADLVRLGLAGTLRELRFTTADGSIKTGAQVSYAGQPAGYASQPGEVVNYVENHDNATLFDINVLKLPRDTPSAERARVQVLGLAYTLLAQGVPYIHAGVEILRSKSLERNSFDSGDWFNRLDWTLQDNHFGTGLPPRAENAALWPLMQPLLAQAATIRPSPADIRFTRDAFLDLLKIRGSSSLFRLRTADDVQRRLTLLNTGPDQDPAVVVGLLNGRGLPGAVYGEVLYAINTSPEKAVLLLPNLQGKTFQLHPIHRMPNAADSRPLQSAQWEAVEGRLTVPPRTALVYVSNASGP